MDKGNNTPDLDEPGKIIKMMIAILSGIVAGVSVATGVKGELDKYLLPLLLTYLGLFYLLTLVGSLCERIQQLEARVATYEERMDTQYQNYKEMMRVIMDNIKKIKEDIKSLRGR